MAIKKKLRSNNCLKKIQFNNKQLAMKQINQAWHRSIKITNKNLKRPIRAYKCHECDMWHMTSKAIGRVEI